MRGYWNDPAQTAAAVRPGGWLMTGDLCRLDADGNLTLVGRRTDLYIRGGYNVYPTEIGTVLDAHPLVAQSAVVGGPDLVLGQVGVAFVVMAGSGAVPAPTLEDLQRWCRSKLADYKAPDRLVLVDSLPLTAMGKVDRQALNTLVAKAAGDVAVEEVSQ